METKKYYASALTAFTIWGFFSIALRAVRDYEAGEILYFRILFSFVLISALVLLLKRQDTKRDWVFLKSMTPKQRRTSILLILAGGVLLTVNWLAFIYIVNHINVKTAAFSYLICPVLTAVLGYLLLHEKMVMVQWVAVALCSLSCLLIGFNSTLELGYSIFTALSYALYLISQRKLQGFDRLVVLAVQIAFSLLLLTVFFFQLVHVVPSDLSFYMILFMIAIVFTIVPLFLNLYALNKINSATIGILMYVNPLLNFMVAIVIFKETVNRLQLMGYLVILIAVVIFNVPNFVKIKNAYRPSKQQ